MSDQLINLHPAWHSQSAGPDLRAGLRLVGQGPGLEKAWKNRSRTSQTLGPKACQNISNPATSQKKRKVFILFLSALKEQFTQK